MKNIRRYLTQNISLDRIQNVVDLGIHDRMKKILETPGYDELKVQLWRALHGVSWYLLCACFQYETAWTITNLAVGRIFFTTSVTSLFMTCNCSMAQKNRPPTWSTLASLTLWSTAFEQQTTTESNHRYCIRHVHDERVYLYLSDSSPLGH